MVDVSKLRSLAIRWREEAISQVPDVYAIRGLQHKFFKLDNEAAGLMSCSDELLELLESDAEQRRVPDPAEQNVAFRCANCGYLAVDNICSGCGNCSS